MRRTLGWSLVALLAVACERPDVPTTPTASPPGGLVASEVAAEVASLAPVPFNARVPTGAIPCGNSNDHACMRDVGSVDGPTVTADRSECGLDVEWESQDFSFGGRTAGRYWRMFKDLQDPPNCGRAELQTILWSFRKPFPSDPVAYYFGSGCVDLGPLLCPDFTIQLRITPPTTELTPIELVLPEPWVVVDGNNFTRRVVGGGIAVRMRVSSFRWFINQRFRVWLGDPDGALTFFPPDQIALESDEGPAGVVIRLIWNAPSWRRDILKPAIFAHFEPFGNLSPFGDKTGTVAMEPIRLPPSGQKRALIVTADKTTVRPGEAVEFTAGAVNTVELRIREWQYVPDPEEPPVVSAVTQQTGIIEGCQAGDTRCVYAPAQSGHMHVEATGDGEPLRGDSPDIEVMDRTLQVRLVVSPPEIRPHIRDVGFGSCTRRYPAVPPDVASVTVEASYSDGAPATDVVVRLHSEFLATSGGHDHQAADRQGFGNFRDQQSRGTGPSVSAHTGLDGRLFTSYEAGHVGGQERITVTADDGAQTASAVQVLTIRVGSFGDMQPNPSRYLLVGTTSAVGMRHLTNHWAVTAIISHLHIIAGTLQEQSKRGGVIMFNDMNLELGGVFDLGPGFTDGTEFGPPHYSHNRGVDVDIEEVYAGTGDPAERLQFDALKRAVRNQASYAVLENEGNHYHVRFLPCP